MIADYKMHLLLPGFTLFDMFFADKKNCPSQCIILYSGKF